MDKNGTIYLESVENGFYIWQYPSAKVTHYNKWDINPADSSRASNILIPSFADSKNNIWFTSNNGLYKYNIKKATWHQLGNLNEQLPIQGETNDVAEDKQGHIWIAGIANGLFEYYTANGKEIIKQYNHNSNIGLPADYCWRIQQSPVDSCLWISNINGLLKFDPIRKQVTSVFTRQNGLDEDNAGYTFTILPNNQLVQLFYASMNIIDLATYKENNMLPAICFNSVKVSGREYVTGIKEEMPLLDLSANENFLQFEFTALVFNNGNRNRYAWQLSGVDTGWINGGNTNEVSYAALKPGSYTFTVKACNNDGRWGKERKISIVIHPPVYARWWFIVSSLLLLAVVLYCMYREKLRRVRRDEKLKAAFRQQLAETEMKALRAQMNPHFIFNSLNSIQKYILKNDQFNASQYLTKFSKLIRLILDHSNQSNILLNSELDLLKLYIEMESMRFDNSFNVDIKVDRNIQADNMLIPSMLVQPYVENAIWHGLLHKKEKGSLLLQFSLQQDKLLVVIDDDGIGRAKAMELKSKQLLTKKSYGMQITQDRISIINSIQGTHTTCTIIDKKDNNGNATGTTVQLHIPVKKLKEK